MDEQMRRAVVVDVDGTIADHIGIRGHHDYGRVDHDAPVEAIIRLVQLLAERYEIVIVSGRPERVRAMTEEWLERNHVAWSLLLMRRNHDNRADDIVKRELYDAHIRGHYEVELVLDDRDRVVKMWRALGLTCLQVAEGDF
ncbi:MAG: polynucleotide 5-hydroxyl-kinase [Acidimicrobiaceae bacterium]|nr:polynucleotide 5-hydroxyl-kinase [Acidimicrobiaceae bacterium]